MSTQHKLAFTSEKVPDSQRTIIGARYEASTVSCNCSYGFFVTLQNAEVVGVDLRMLANCRSWNRIRLQ